MQMLTITDLIKLFSKDTQAIVFHESAGEKFAQLQLADSLTSIFLIIGPEGGISPNEISIFENTGCKVVRLGETVLRSAHAGFAAISAIQTKLGRW
jgi:16S rRNA (uracil1498-N3)-methyltransferase